MGPAVVADGALGIDVPDVADVAAAFDTAEEAGAPADPEDDFDSKDPLFALLPLLFVFPALPNKLFFCADNDIGVA